jgi:hypothetical protein
MGNNMTKYYVRYVDNSTPNLKRFKTLKAAKDFVAKFKKKNPDPSDGWWVDYIVVGQILEADEYFEEQL